jgi:hypothetical protein
LGLLNRTIHKVNEAVGEEDPERLARTYEAVLNKVFNT